MSASQSHEDAYSTQARVAFTSELDSLPEVEFRDPDLWLYRKRTVALLKRYLRISIEVGRLPSLLGRELFRSKVTSYRMSSFEDAVIFVHDVERALEHLDDFSKKVVATIVFQDYGQDEAAEVLRCARRTICRAFPDALDKISEIFLEGGLLNRLPPAPVENSCQEGEEGDFCLSDCKQAEFLQSVAQFPFLYAILKLESKKTERAFGCALSFCPGNHYAESENSDERRIHHGSRCSAGRDYRVGGAQCSRNGATGDRCRERRRPISGN